jgi:hypothetical protein
MGFRDCFLLVAAVFVFGLIPAWIMGRGSKAATVVQN